MAEEDVMLVAIRMDAKGAITDTQILDDKFKNLSTTFRKGTQETKKLETVMAKQVKTTKDAKLANIDLSATYLKTLAGLDALTSGLNQGISAQYKMIDAKLASGEIDEEEAERLRKKWKAREKHTASLEMAISVMRLATVGHMVYTSVVGMSSTAILANTKTVWKNSAAWLANPLFWAFAGIVVGISMMLYALVKLAQHFNVLERALGVVNKAFELFKGFVDWWVELGQASGRIANDFADSLTGNNDYQKEMTRKLEQEAIS